jgi:Spherulation-specific family 4
MLSGNLYVIYYGWLTSDSSGQPNSLATTIAAARPRALIAVPYTAQPRFLNLSPQVRDLFRSVGTQIFAYAASGYGARDRGEVQGEVADYLMQGVDGIFYDETAAQLDRTKMKYYRHLYALVKDWGRKVIMNTGVAASSESLMEVSDILMFEHQWRAFSQTCAWRSRYAPERFMGNSSNEPGSATHLGYHIDRDVAVRETREAWAHGIGWHYSTDRYTELPDWFSNYCRTVRDGA